MPSQKRLFELDALRGLSLFGIVLMNILVFSMPYEEAYLPDIVHGINEGLLRIVTLVVISSFYPIFSFLFGYGLAIMYENIQYRGLRYYPIIYRRLACLLVIGLIHGCFIFSGDILFGYAFTGMLAVLLIKKKTKILIKTATILFVLKIILIVIPFSVFSWNTGRNDTNNFSGMSLGQLIDVKQNGNYVDLLKININETVMSVLDVMTTSAYLEFLPYILCGIIAQKLNLITVLRNNDYQKRATFWGMLCIVIGYTLKVPFAIDYSNNAFQYISAMVGGPIVAAGYILIFLRLCQVSKVRKVVHLFEYPGKLSLTVYLSQSIIFTLIYMGLGLYNKLELYQSYLIVLIVYSLQVCASYYYLKKFKQGPVEWAWRKITYLK
ncbi:DUF418 domain-containing protein [Staphylococcus succinus]|uniref:DUF418 domain-containing protein n=1 Tax=Staphylococcus succinus TaxID=61015 RepID=UPI000D1E7A0E|nr:DUF418 domain-containing protein [Staphylococcus succinus]PTI48382.1 DUF418 domain-containing protein [Staphylococcus succinus]